MKLGIKWGDNDFHNQIRAFFDLFIIPTFKDIGEGHMTTYLTPSMIVELFKTHMPYIDRYLKWQFNSKYYPQYKTLYDFPLSNYFIISESDVFFDGDLDKAITDWDDFIYWTDGKTF